MLFSSAPILSKLLAVVGIVLAIVGGAAFLHSLGSGGGYLAAALIILGAILFLAALLRVLVTPILWLSGLVLWATLASSLQVTAPIAEIDPPDLNLLLQRMEDVQHQDPAQSRPYQVTREYKVFHGSDTKSTSEVTAQIDFVPPDMKTYKIIQATGNSRGEKMVRELLDRETDSAKKGPGGGISRANYDFVFLRKEDFGVIPEYVLGIVPKRKDKLLLRGQIWVDASTFRIRRIEGVPAKSPSFWLRNIHITLQFAQLGGMWVPVSFDAIATVRLFGQFTLAGHNIRSFEARSSGTE